MRKTVLAALLTAPLWASAATNLITNGSFEDGLSGWTVGGSVSDAYPVVVIDYNSTAPYPTSAFGESIPADNAVNLGPDAAGSKALYFVSDASTQTVSQTVNLSTAGKYTFGLDAYLPNNGFANPIDATFSVSVGGFVLGPVQLSQLSAGAWQPSFSNLNLNAGPTTVTFTFLTSAFPAKDLVIDKVYLISTPVPEAGTAAMMLAGLASLGFIAARRRPQR